MKKTIPFIALILLGACSYYHPKTAETETTTETRIIPANSPNQTVHQFIEYLKHDNLNGAKAMFAVQDTSTERHRKFFNYEMIQMDRARKALQQDDITSESLWSRGITTIDGRPYFCIVGAGKKDIHRSHFESVFKFVFSFYNSDTLLDFFDFNPPKDDEPETSADNKQMQLVHALIKCLKNNDTKTLKEILGLDHINITRNGIKRDSKSKKWLEYESSKIDSAAVALQHIDVDESSWTTRIVAVEGNPRILFISGYLQKKEGSPYSGLSIGFGFTPDKLDTAFACFDFPQY